MTNFELTTTMVAYTCGDCGMTFGVPWNYYQRWKEGGTSSDRLIHCVGCGHRWYYGEGELARQKRRTEVAERSRDFYQERARAEERSKNAVKGHLTRTKKRVACGLCPCCKRSFQNLRRHMESKHPGYAEAPP